MVRTFLRDAAIPMTWLLLHTAVSANQVTLAALLIGLAGCYAVSLQGDAGFVLGCFLLQFWYYLDHVDGQIARYRKQDCLTGRFFDFLMHHVIHGVLVFMLGAYFFYRDAHVAYLFIAWALSCMILVFNMLHDIKCKAFIEKITAGGEKTLRVMTREIGGKTAHEDVAKKSLKTLFSAAHKSVEIHVMMNLMTLGALVNMMLAPCRDSRSLLFVWYAVTLPVLVTAKAVHAINTRKYDEEYAALFKTL